jgi:hypothetical protein
MPSSSVTENFVDLKIVFNGQPFDQQVNVHQPLRPVFERSLAHFGLQPAQPEEYGLFFGDPPTPLDLGSKIQDLNLPAGAVLLLQRRTPPRGGF